MPNDGTGCESEIGAAVSAGAKVIALPRPRPPAVSTATRASPLLTALRASLVAHALSPASRREARALALRWVPQ